MKSIGSLTDCSVNLLGRKVSGRRLASPTDSQRNGPKLRHCVLQPCLTLALSVRIFGVGALRIVDRAFLNLFEEVRFLADEVQRCDSNMPASQKTDGRPGAWLTIGAGACS